MAAGLNTWPSPRAARYTVGVLLLAYTFSFIDRTIVALLVQPIKHDLGLTDTQISLLHGLAFAIFYTVLGVPLGRLADRRTRRTLVAAGIFTWSLMTAACGLCRSYGQLFLARVGVGVGEAALSPAAYSMIADSFPPGRIGRAVSTYSVGVYVGSGLAFLIGGAISAFVADSPVIAVPLLGEMRAWQFAFLAVGLPGVPIAIWALTLREPARHDHRTGGVAFGDVVRHVGQGWRVYGAHFAGFSLLSLAFNAFVAWAPSVLIRRFALTHSAAGYALGWGILLLGSAGIWCGGWLADEFGRRGYRDGPLRVGLISGVGLTPFAILGPTMPDATLTLAFFYPFIFFGSFGFGAAAAALQLITPNEMRGQVSALYLFLINLIGIGCGPTVTALVTDRVFGSENAVGQSLAWVAGTAAPLAAAVLWTGLKPYRDRRRNADLRDLAVDGAGSDPMLSI